MLVQIFIKPGKLGLCLLFQFSDCNCTTEGSNGITCDDTGVCNCKANIVNDKCDECATGYFNFPSCEGKQYFDVIVQDVLP